MDAENFLKVWRETADYLEEEKEKVADLEAELALLKGTVDPGASIATLLEQVRATPITRTDASIWLKVHQEVTEKIEDYAQSEKGKRVVTGPASTQRWFRGDGYVAGDVVIPKFGTYFHGKFSDLPEGHGLVFCARGGPVNQDVLVGPLDQIKEIPIALLAKWRWKHGSDGVYSHLQLQYWRVRKNELMLAELFSDIEDK